MSYELIALEIFLGVMAFLIATEIHRVLAVLNDILEELRKANKKHE